MIFTPESLLKGVSRRHLVREPSFSFPSTEPVMEKPLPFFPIWAPNGVGSQVLWSHLPVTPPAGPCCLQCLPPSPHLSQRLELTLPKQEASNTELLGCDARVLSPSPPSGRPATDLPPLPTSKQAASYQRRPTCLLPECSKTRILAWASQILGRLVWLPCGICCLLPRVSFFRFCPFLCLLALCLEEFDRV